MAELGTPDDGIVVGTGSAGDVIIWRVPDDGLSGPAIEAGPADTEADSHRPLGWPMPPGGMQDWSVPATHEHQSGDDWAATKARTGWDSDGVLLFLSGVHDRTPDRPAAAPGHAAAGLPGPRWSADYATRTCSPRATWTPWLTRPKSAAQSAPRMRSKADARPRRPRP